MPKASPNIDPERLAAYDRVIATRAEVERKGAKIAYTSLNGHMTSYLDAPGSMVLRLSPDERRRFMETYGTSLHTAHGVVQPEFVDVPDGLLEDTASLEPWFAASIGWVASLKPKPTKRKG